MTANCTVCYAPLNSGLFSQIATLQCKHQLHLACFITWKDYIYTTAPETKELSCPECRHIVPIEQEHSAQRIVKYIGLAYGICATLSSILGSHVGTRIATLGASPGSIFAPICSIIYKTLRISPVKVLPLVGAGICLAGSYLMTSPGSRCSLWIDKAVTSVYNYIHGTEISSATVVLYKSQFSKLPPEKSLHIAVQYFLDIKILNLLNTLRLDIFPAEDQDSVDKVIVAITSLRSRNMENNDQALAKSYCDALKQHDPDIYAKSLSLGMRLIDKIGNEEIKEGLKDKIDIFISYFVGKMVTSVSDSRSGIRIGAVYVTDILKKAGSYSEEKKKAFISLLTKINEECKQPNSPLIQQLLDCDISQKYNFAELSPAESLCNNGISGIIWLAIQAVKQQEFLAAGLEIDRVDFEADSDAEEEVSI